TLTPTSLTDLQLYNKTLRKEELLHNAESKGLKKLKPGVVVQDGLVLHYDFSHESNTSEYKGKAFDYSGNGNHGVLENFNFTEESGYIGNSLQFDGVDDTIKALNPLSYQTSETQAWSVELVLKTQHLNAGSVVNKLVWGINIGLDLRHLGDDNQVTFLNFIANSALSYLYALKRKVDLNEIVHVVFSYDSKTKENSIVINSKFKESLIIDAEQHPPTGMEKEIYLSHNKKKNTFYSTKIYNRPLTPEEITHNYQIEKEKFNITEGEM